MLWHHRSRGARLADPDCEQRIWGALEIFEQCRRARGGAPVVHVHVPKTAGISICTWAKSAGFRARRFFDARCHVRGDGPFWLGEPAIPISCEQRLRKVAQANTSWMSVERWVDLPLCEDLQYVVILREPMVRTLHHFRHLILFFMTIHGSINEVDTNVVAHDLYGKLWAVAHSALRLREGREPLATNERVAAIAGLSDWLDLWVGLASNYQVRTLAGAGGGHAYLEEARLAEGRGPAAEQVLEQMDVVMVLGEDSLLEASQARHLAALLLLPASSSSSSSSTSDAESRGLPGDAGGADVESLVREIPKYSHLHGVEGPLAPKPVEHMWARGEMLRLRQLNAADTALVKHGALLQRLDEEYLRRFPEK